MRRKRTHSRQEKHFPKKFSNNIEEQIYRAYLPKKYSTTGTIQSKDTAEIYKNHLKKHKKRKEQRITMKTTSSLENLVERIPHATITNQVNKYPDRVELNVLGEDFTTYKLRLYVVENTNVGPLDATSLQNVNIQKTLEKNIAEGYYSTFLIAEPKNPTARTALAHFTENSYQEQMFKDDDLRFDLTYEEGRAVTKISATEHILQAYNNGKIKYKIMQPSVDTDGKVQELRPTYKTNALTSKTKSSSLEVIIPADLATPALIVPIETTTEGKAYIANWKKQLQGKPLSFEENYFVAKKEISFEDARALQVKALNTQNVDQYLKYADITGMNDEINYFS